MVGAAVWVLSAGLIDRPVLAIAVNLVVAGGLAPAMWLSRDIPVLRWIAAGGAVGLRRRLDRRDHAAVVRLTLAYRGRSAAAGSVGRAEGRREEVAEDRRWDRRRPHLIGQQDRRDARDSGSVQQVLPMPPSQP